MGDGKLFLHAGTGHGRQLGRGGLVRDTLVMGEGEELLSPGHKSKGTAFKSLSPLLKT